jgi:nicotinamide-nucleotide amidase
MKQNSRKIIFRLISELAVQQLTLSLVESATCGMAAQMLNTVPGTSDVFLGSIVCYHESVKTSLLKVKPALIKKYTAESQQVTDAITRNLKKLIPADIYAGVTGLSTDGGTESAAKPVGTMFVSIYYKNRLHRFKKKFNGSPIEIRKKSCLFIFSSIYKIISNG